MRFYIIVFVCILLCCMKSKNNAVTGDETSNITVIDTNEVVNKFTKYTCEKRYFGSNCEYELTIHFYYNLDTVYFDYFCTTIDDGAINEAWEENQYAGKFLKSDIKDNSIFFYIINYRMNSEKYLLDISYINDSTIEWNIDSNNYKFVPYLPHSIILNIDN